MKQILENAAGANVTASASEGTASYDDITRTFTLTAEGKTVSWAKLEIGGCATSFVPPDPATELTKCQRYFVRLSADRTISKYAYNGVGAIFSNTMACITVALPVRMRTSRPITVTMSDPPCEIITPSKGINNTYIPTSIKEWSSMAGTCLQIVFSITDGIVGEIAMLLFRNNNSSLDFDAEI